VQKHTHQKLSLTYSTREICLHRSFTHTRDQIFTAARSDLQL
jgi:hypothetical protein